MPGYKNYTIKKYEKGGLVETKRYKDGKTTIETDSDTSRLNRKLELMQKMGAGPISAVTTLYNMIPEKSRAGKFLKNIKGVTDNSKEVKKSLGLKYK
jgi:hypothetical protein